MQALCAELKELGDAESVGDGFTLRLTECTEEIGNALTFWHTNF